MSHFSDPMWYVFALWDAWLEMIVKAVIIFLDTLWYVIGLANAFFFYQLLKTFLPMRGIKLVQLSVLIPCCLIVNKVIFYTNVINYLVMFLFLFFTLVIFFKGGLIQKISVVIILCPLIASVNFLYDAIGSLIFEHFPEAEGLYVSIAHTGFYIPAAILWYSLWKWGSRHFKDIVELLDTKTLLALDIIFICLLTSLFIVIYPPNISQAYSIAAVAIVTIFGIMSFIAYIADSVRTNYRIKELQMEYQYYENKLKEEEQVRSVYHDMKNHLLLLQAGNPDLSAEIIDAIQDRISNYENYYKTGNTLLDIIIRDKAEKARECEIDFSAMLRFESGGFIEALDISSIFGNALDNAIEASLKLPPSERLITAKADCIHDSLSIKIENHMADKIAPGMKTDKRDKLFHGLGYKSIEQAVAKYEGQCSFKQTDGHFTLTIIIPIPSMLI